MNLTTCSSHECHPSSSLSPNKTSAAAAESVRENSCVNSFHVRRLLLLLPHQNSEFKEERRSTSRRMRGGITRSLLHSCLIMVRESRQIHGPQAILRQQQLLCDKRPIRSALLRARTLTLGFRFEGRWRRMTLPVAAALDVACRIDHQCRLEEEGVSEGIRRQSCGREGVW